MYLVLTLCRVYTSGTDQQDYQYLFTQVFALMSEIIQHPIQWRHIHNTGIYGVTIDMDTAQIKGILLIIYYQYITNI